MKMSYGHKGMSGAYGKKGKSGRNPMKGKKMPTMKSKELKPSHKGYAM